MATDFISVKTLVPGGALYFETLDTPTDIRTRVENFNEIADIPNPYVGMQVYVKDEDTTYTLNEQCMKMQSNGFSEEMVVDLEAAKTKAAKMATSSNILDMMDGETLIGPSGPGIERRFANGTFEGPNEVASNYSKDDRDPDYWFLPDSFQGTTAEYPYVWAIEATLKWNVTLKTYELDGTWGDPVRISGKDGVDGQDGKDGKDGADGSDFQIMGVFPTLEELMNTVKNPQPGEAYGVGAEKPYDIYIWDDINKVWVNHGAIQGAKGDDGDPAWQSITKFVFTSTSNNEDKFSAPATPTDGSYDFTTGEFTPPTGWALNDEVLEAPIWMTSKTFIDETKANAPKEEGWSEPLMISGKDGKDGEDGPGIEYVYMLTETDAAPETRPEETRPEGGVDANGWHDNPQGVSEEYPCEWVMMRTGTTYAWGEWQGPTLWSKYGANGKDGDGVEYVYYLSNSNEAPGNPTPEDYDSIKDNTDEEIVKHLPDGWADNPHGVDINDMYEYVSVRKKTNGEWGRFSDPKLWAKFSQDGTAGLPGESTLAPHIDNPMDSVLLDADGKPTAGFPCKTNFVIYHGSNTLTLTEFKVSEVSDALVKPTTHYTVSKTGSIGTLQVDSLPISSESKVIFKLQGKAMVNTSNGDPVEKTFETSFLINKISASAPNIMVDIANENINVPCNADKTLIDDVQSITNTINAFRGGDPLKITSVVCLSEGCSITRTNDTDNNSYEFKMTSLPAVFDSCGVSLKVTLEDGTERDIKFNIVKIVPGVAGEAAEFYELSPNLNSIRKDGNGNLKDNTLTTKYIHRKGASTTIEDNRPSNYRLYYSVDTDTYDITKNSINGNELTIPTSVANYIKLYLVEIIDSNPTLMDVETIYVTYDGTDGKDGAKGDKGDKGDTGATGATGADGKGIKSSTTQYVISDSNTEIPATGWSSTLPNITPDHSGQYLWTKVTWTYTDNTTSTAYQTNYIPKNGADGMSAIRTVTKFIYTSTKVEPGKTPTPPAIPTGGSVDFDTNKLNSKPSNWYEAEDTEYANLQKPIWMSSRTFIENGESTWSFPIPITGVDGEPGEDGSTYEYGYKRSETNVLETDDQPVGNIPEGGHTVNGWYDNPQGVDETWKYEFISVRRNGGSWTTPVLWSKYGEKGQDGDGVEYIYYLSNSSTAPAKPSTPTDTGWKQEPTGVTSTRMYEYVSVRKRTNGEWGAFSDPKLWAKYGAAGANGANAVLYKLTCSDSTVRVSNTDVVKNGPQGISINVIKVDGTTLNSNVTLGTGGLYMNMTVNGNTSTITRLPHALTQSSLQNYVTAGANDILFTLMYQGSTIDSISIPVVKDGPAGARGRLMYFAGNWKSGDTYEADESSTPYVYSTSDDGKAGGYYYLARDNNSNILDVSPYNDWNANQNTTNYTWKVIPNMEVIYANVGLFEQANVGPAVFYKDWVFSQANASGTSLTNFGEFTFDEDTGMPTGNSKDTRPMMWFNFKTGQGSLAGEKITWGADGNLEIKANIKVNSLDTKEEATGDKVKIEGNSVKVLNADGTENVILSNNVIGNISASELNNDSTTAKDFELTNKIKSLSKISSGTNNYYISSFDGGVEVTSGISTVYKIYKPQATWTSGGEHGYYNIGMINAGGTISFKNQVALFKKSTGSSTQTSIGWAPDADNMIQPTSVSMGSGTKTIWDMSNVSTESLQVNPINDLTVTIEKFDGTTNSWKQVKVLSALTTGKSWVPATYRASYNGSNIIKYNYIRQIAFDYTVEVRGIYRAYVTFDPRQISINSDNLSIVGIADINNDIKSFSLKSTYSVSRNFSNEVSFTEFGQNGMIVKGRNNIFLIDENEITLSNANFGFRLDNNGFSYLKTETIDGEKIATWKVIDFSKLEA